MLRMLALILSLSCSCVAMSAQQVNSTAELLSALKSPDVQQRMDAYQELKKDQDALKRSDVKAALLDLLDRENRVIHQTLVDSDGKHGTDDKYGEGYAEYTGYLLGTVSEFADWHDPRQLCVLAQSAYNPDSAFAMRLAVEGGAAVAPCLLEIAQGRMYRQNDPASVRVGYDQAQAVPVLVHLSAIRKDLSPAVRQQIRELTIVGLRGDSRFAIIQALERFGTPDMIPILQDVARSDPYSRILDNGQRRFDVREAVAKAVRSIQGRVQNGDKQ